MRKATLGILLGTAGRLFAGEPVIFSAELRDSIPMYHGPTLKIRFEDDKPIPSENVFLYRKVGKELIRIPVIKYSNGNTKESMWYNVDGEMPFSAGPEDIDFEDGSLDEYLLRELERPYDLTGEARTDRYVVAVIDTDNHLTLKNVDNNLSAKPKRHTSRKYDPMARVRNVAVRNATMNAFRSRRYRTHRMLR